MTQRIAASWWADDVAKWLDGAGFAEVSSVLLAEAARSSVGSAKPKHTPLAVCVWALGKLGTGKGGDGWGHTEGDDDKTLILRISLHRKRRVIPASSCKRTISLQSDVRPLELQVDVRWFSWCVQVKQQEHEPETDTETINSNAGRLEM